MHFRQFRWDTVSIGQRHFKKGRTHQWKKGRRERDRESERETDRQTDRQRQTQRQRERGREGDAEARGDREREGGGGRKRETMSQIPRGTPGRSFWVARVVSACERPRKMQEREGGKWRKSGIQLLQARQQYRCGISRHHVDEPTPCFFRFIGCSRCHYLF